MNKIETALWRAYHLGQVYWQQADSESYIQQAKSDQTQQKFITLIQETILLLDPKGFDETV